MNLNNIPLITAKPDGPHMPVDYQPGPLAELMSAAGALPDGRVAFKANGGQLRDVVNAIPLLAAHINRYGLEEVTTNHIGIALDIAEALHREAWNRLVAKEKKKGGDSDG